MRFLSMRKGFTGKDDWFDLSILSISFLSRRSDSSDLLAGGYLKNLVDIRVTDPRAEKLIGSYLVNLVNLRSLLMKISEDMMTDGQPLILVTT